MGKRELIPFSEVYDLVSSSSQNHINNFLSKYTPSSQEQYKSQVSFIIYHTGKHDVSLLTLQDYEGIKEKASSKKSKRIYIDTIFKYLYAYNILIDDSGFELLWVRDTEKKRFENLRKVKRNGKLTSKGNVLSIEDITILHELAKQEHERELTVKRCFLWEMLFYTDCSVKDLQFFTKERYVENSLLTKRGELIPIPPKYYTFLESYLNHGGFTDMNDTLLQLGKLVGIENLTPRRIQATRKANQLSCSNCGEKYMNESVNWTSVNGRVICIICANSLKKNSSFKIEPLVIFELANDESRKISPSVYTYEEQRRKLSNKVDYLKLHKYKKEIGDLGEAYVYDLEFNKLKGTKYAELIDSSKADDPRNGYDILSFDIDGAELFIEVKTSVQRNQDFYISDTELNMAKSLLKQGKKYIVYRVENILAEDRKDIHLEKIHNILDTSKYSFQTYNWKVSINI